MKVKTLDQFYKQILLIDEIFTYSHFNIVFKTCNDISIFVVGEYEENELVTLIRISPFI